MPACGSRPAGRSQKGDGVKVGVPREVKDHEYRVAITPAGAHEFVRHGHEVWVEAGAGVGFVDHRRRLPCRRGADRAERGAGVGRRRPGAQGERAGPGGVPPAARGPGALRLPASGRHQRMHRCAAGAAGHRRGLRDGRHRRRCAAPAGPDERGRRPARPAGRGVPPHALRGRARGADERGPRRLRGQGGGARRRRGRHERRRDRAGDAGRGATAGQEHQQAARRPTRSTRVTCRRSPPTPTRWSGRCSTPTW